MHFIFSLCASGTIKRAHMAYFSQGFSEHPIISKILKSFKALFNLPEILLFFL